MFNILDKFLEYFILPLIILMFVLLFVGLGFSVYDYFYAEKFTLVKSEWHCNRYEKNKITYFINSGKILVPVTNTIENCVEWIKK